MFFFSLEPSRLRRQAVEEIANFLASMPPKDIENNSFTQSYDSNTTIEVYTLATTKLILKPSIVDTQSLKQSIVLKPDPVNEQPTPKPICNKFYCCYHYNTTSQNTTIGINSTFICQEKLENQSNDCKDILKLCSTSTSQICSPDKTDYHCRIDQICGNEKKSECSIQSIETAFHPTTTTTSPTPTPITTTPALTTTLVPTTTTPAPTTTPVPTTTTTPIPTTTPTPTTKTTTTTTPTTTTASMYS